MLKVVVVGIYQWAISSVQNILNSVVLKCPKLKSHPNKNQYLDLAKNKFRDQNKVKFWVTM